MPIYAYKCGSCGHAKDVLRKLSDPPLTLCPVCGAESFSKQVTAAGFQLKGSGWYATDFRGGSTSAPAPASGEGDGKKADGAKPADSAAKPADTSSSKPAESGAASSKSDAPKASAGCGGASACD